MVRIGDVRRPYDDGEIEIVLAISGQLALVLHGTSLNYNWVLVSALASHKLLNETDSDILLLHSTCERRGNAPALLKSQGSDSAFKESELAGQWRTLAKLVKALRSPGPQ